jgi:arginyl-tRNA synthetase
MIAAANEWATGNFEEPELLGDSTQLVEFVGVNVAGNGHIGGPRLEVLAQCQKVDRKSVV